MAIEIIDIKGNIEEYLNTVSGKTVIIGYGFTLDNIKDEDGEKTDKGRAIYMIVNGAGKEPSAGWRFIDAKTHFQCALNGMIDALDKTIDDKEVVFISTAPLNLDKRDHCERVLFEALSHKAEEKGLTAAWGNYDTETAENKGSVSRYLRQNAKQMFDSMTDYWGCPLMLFDKVNVECDDIDDIERRLNERSGDILIVSAPVSIGNKEYTTISMMRLVVDNTAKLLIYEGSEAAQSINEATLNGMLTMAECLAPAKESADFTVYLAAQYKLGFYSDSSPNRPLCGALYNTIKERGYNAVVLEFGETNKEFKKRQKTGGEHSKTRSKSEIIRNYIFAHKKRATPLDTQFDDPCMNSYIIENYL